jgi:hypothetical protein
MDGLDEKQGRLLVKNWCNDFAGTAPDGEAVDQYKAIVLNGFCKFGHTRERERC